MRIGLPLVGATLVGTVVAGVNVFFIGRSAGAAGVGLFTLGENVAAWPLGLFLPVLLNVGLPLFAQIRDDPVLVRDVFSRCVELMMWAFLPVCVLLTVLAPSLVETLYGSQVGRCRRRPPGPLPSASWGRSSASSASTWRSRAA